MSKELQLALISTDREISQQALDLANEFWTKLLKANPNKHFSISAKQMMITADLIQIWQKRYEFLASQYANAELLQTADINRLAYCVVLARLVKTTGISEMITGE